MFYSQHGNNGIIYDSIPSSISNGNNGMVDLPEAGVDADHRVGFSVAGSVDKWRLGLNPGVASVAGHETVALRFHLTFGQH